MKLYKKTYFNFLLAIAATVLLVACSDDDSGVSADVPRDIVPELRNGVFIQFGTGSTPPPTVSFAEPEAAGFSIPIQDLNGNAVEYSLDVEATIGGNTFIGEDVIVITEFPTTLNVSIAEIAAALSLPLEEISFGDSFSFVATATDAEGNASIGSEPNIRDDGTLAVGTTRNELLVQPSFNSAMRFGFTLACPAFTVDDVVGTYDVVAIAFAGATGSFPEISFVRTVVAGPGENQFTIVEGEYEFYGSDPLIVTFDPNTGSVLEINEDGLAFTEALSGLTDNNYVLIDGLVLPCAGNGIIDLNLNFSVFNTNPHDFILEKQ